LRFFMFALVPYIKIAPKSSAGLTCQIVEPDLHLILGDDD